MINGKRLREIREAAQLSQKELADAVGVTQQCIQRAEMGTKDLSLSVAVSVARILGCRIEDFIREEETA